MTVSRLQFNYFPSLSLLLREGSFPREKDEATLYMYLLYHPVEFVPDLNLIDLQRDKRLLGEGVGERSYTLAIYQQAGHFAAGDDHGEHDVEGVSEIVGVVDIEDNVHDLRQRKGEQQQSYEDRVRIIRRAFTQRRAAARRPASHQRKDPHGESQHLHPLSSRSVSLLHR